MAEASAGLAPGTIGRIGRSAHVHFFLPARGWPGATLATLVTLAILPPITIIFPLTIIVIIFPIITIAKTSYMTAIFI